MQGLNVRRSYQCSITFNGKRFDEVIIDPHFEAKHSEISDAIILALLKDINGMELEPEGRKDNWEFFELDNHYHEGKPYRIVWCTQNSTSFIGIINCFRRSRIWRNIN